MIVGAFLKNNILFLESSGNLGKAIIKSKLVNNLDFMSIKTPEKILGDIKFDCTVYDRMCEHKGYLKFIKENYNKDLITFGSQFLD